MKSIKEKLLLTHNEINTPYNSVEEFSMFFFPDRLLGKFVLGSYMFARGRALQHWNSAISSPMEQVKQWHPLTN